MSGDGNPELRAVPIVGGPETEGVASVRHIEAKDLTQAHVGQFAGCHDEQRGVNYLAKLLKIQRFETGSAPGVSVWVRHSEIEGRPAFEERWHLPFDSEVELIDIAAL